MCWWPVIGNWEWVAVKRKGKGLYVGRAPIRLPKSTYGHIPTLPRGRADLEMTQWSEQRELSLDLTARLRTTSYSSNSKKKSESVKPSVVMIGRWGEAGLMGRGSQAHTWPSHRQAAGNRAQRPLTLSHPWTVFLNALLSLRAASLAMLQAARIQQKLGISSRSRQSSPGLRLQTWSRRGQLRVQESSLSRKLHLSTPSLASRGGTWPDKCCRLHQRVSAYALCATDLNCLYPDTQSSSKYSNTLNLPKTEFPMRADAAKREPGLLRPEVYSWQQVRHQPLEWCILLICIASNNSFSDSR